MLSFLSGLARRLLGGWLSSVEILKERGVQWLICALIYGPVMYFNKYDTWLYDNLNIWLFATLGTFFIIWAETKGHFPGFKCGTESKEYIDQQLANGRKIAFKNFVDWIGKIRGFEQYGAEWCFWQLLINKTLYACLPALFVGYQFVFVGLCVGLVYPAMFWVEMKPFKNIMKSPTNWAEFWQGVFYFQGIL